MTYRDVLAKVDHTVLKQTTTSADIQKLCDDALKYHTASICIPPAYVKQAADYLGDRLAVSYTHLPSRWRTPSRA